MTEHGAAEEGLALRDERAWTTAVPRPAAEPQDRSPGFPLGVYSVNVRAPGTVKPPRPLPSAHAPGPDCTRQ